MTRTSQAWCTRFAQFINAKAFTLNYFNYEPHQRKNYKRYEGAALTQYNEPCDLDAYYPSEELKEAVELARLLRRPLLLRGEPGCGKTRLAEALAFELYDKDYKKHYFPWYIKSSTKAREGLYTFDHLKRLRDVNMEKENVDLKTYRKWGKLGDAFRQSTAEKPAIVLIDEIDKADLDFPNDLLLELDESKFDIPETGEDPIEAKYPPIIIITSNDEKELPGAFLRRCIFHYIEFPGEDLLLKIVYAKLAATFEKTLPETAIKQLISRFKQLHENMANSANADLPPSTSALLDWVQIITHNVQAGLLSFTEEGELKNWEDKLPFPGLLLKSFDDYRSFRGAK
ncbi:MAG: MoxR family ATPase [Saprospiraceae bacterium]|nr:MoxR family ATPase [Saprospiraceae bacterium]